MNRKETRIAAEVMLDWCNTPCALVSDEAGTTDSPQWNWGCSRYSVTPNPFRPYGPANIRAMTSTGPLWVVNKVSNDCAYKIKRYDECGVTIGTCPYTYLDLMEKFTHLDGSICGRT